MRAGASVRGRSRIPGQGDIYTIDPNPTQGREMRDRHFFVVVSPAEINRLGVSIAVAITTGGQFARELGLAVPILGHRTTGVAVCNQVRSFDIAARERDGTARYVETLDAATAAEIAARVASVIDPAPEP